MRPAHYQSVQPVLAPMQPEHWPDVEVIYRQGIATGQATFETEAPSWEQWDARHLRFARLVARSGSTILGWAALSPVSVRKVYAGVAEVSVYIEQAARGRGVGRFLLSALIEQSEKNGVWTLQASIFPENTASIALHQSCGFRVVGTRERIAQLAGKWRDTVMMERRSQITGK